MTLPPSTVVMNTATWLHNHRGHVITVETIDAPYLLLRLHCAACRSAHTMLGGEASADLDDESGHLWLDDSVLEHAAELIQLCRCPHCLNKVHPMHFVEEPYLCPECDAELEVDYPRACAESATRLRAIAAAAKASATIGPRGWPVVLVEVQGTGKGMRRPKRRMTRGQQAVAKARGES
jgi:hypothetical protein